MFRYAALFYVVALASTVPAFGGANAQLAVFAQVVFGVFLTLAFLSLALGTMRRGF